MRGHRICKTISRQMSCQTKLRAVAAAESASPTHPQPLNNFPSSPVNKYARTGNYSGYHPPNRYLNTDFSISAPVGNLLKHPLCLHPRGIPTNSQRYHYRSGFPKNIPSKIVERWNYFLRLIPKRKNLCTRTLTHTHFIVCSCSLHLSLSPA